MRGQLESRISGSASTFGALLRLRGHALIGRIAENDDRYLRVIYNAAVTPWRIVTAYFDRGLRSEQ